MKTTRKQLQKLILEAMTGIASMPSAEGVDQIEENPIVKDINIEMIEQILNEGMIAIGNQGNDYYADTKAMIDNDNTIILTAGPLDTPFAEIIVNFKDLSHITKT
tara:strand:+ start:1174 stop:1488 length:315 start_codon:yes stop_codon:yes gene_type:complete